MRCGADPLRRRPGSSALLPKSRLVVLEGSLTWGDWGTVWPDGNLRRRILGNRSAEGRTGLAVVLVGVVVDGPLVVVVVVAVFVLTGAG